jgi:ABC-type sugar transport system, periplasmic component
MKKCFLVLLSLLLLWAAPALAEMPHMGICIYNEKDTFMNSLSTRLQGLAPGRATVAVTDAQNDQNKQNDQIGQMLDAGVDVLIVNPVDRTAAVYLIQMAAKREVPIVFINREPLQSDLDLYEHAYYVGIDPKEQGTLSGQMAAQYFLNTPAADKNRDGVLQLVIVKGEPGHQDAELRTQYAIKALFENEVAVELISQDTAMWERSLGQEKMAALINAYGERIECVLSNNDDMALGAIDALKAAGYFSQERYIPVLGIDATAPAMEALRAGTLYATVVNDAQNQANAAFELALLLSSGERVNSENFPYEMNNKVVYIKSRSITAADE